MFKVIKPTIEAGQLAHLISFYGEHPEPYSDEQLKALKREQWKEALGFVGCSTFMALMFFCLISIL